MDSDSIEGGNKFTPCPPKALAGGCWCTHGRSIGVARLDDRAKRRTFAGKGIGPERRRVARTKDAGQRISRLRINVGSRSRRVPEGQSPISSALPSPNRREIHRSRRRRVLHEKPAAGGIHRWSRRKCSRFDLVTGSGQLGSVYSAWLSTLSGGRLSSGFRIHR